MLRLILQSTARTAAIVGKQSTHWQFSRLNKVQNRLLSVSLNNSQCSLYSERPHTQTKPHSKYDDKKEKVPKTIKILSTNTPSLTYETFQSIQNSLLKSDAITIDNGFAVLKSCSQLYDRTASERALLVQTVWTRLAKLINEPSQRDAIYLINAFCRTGNPLGDHQKFLERFQLDADIEVYERLIYWACRNDGDLKTAERILEEMKAKGLQPTERIYNALIHGNSKYGLSEAYGILDKMKEAGVNPSSGTYKELIIAHLHHNEHTKAIELFEDHFNSTADVSTQQLYAIIRAGAVQQCEPIVIAAINRLPPIARNVKALNDNIRNICVELIHLNRERAPDAQLDVYELIIRHFPVPVYENESSDTYGNYLLREMIASDQNVGDIIKLCQQLKDSQRNVRGLHFCCISALSHKKQIAFDFLRELSKAETLRPHYLWPLFLQVDNDYAALLKLLEFAGETNTQLDARTLQKYVLPQMQSFDGDAIIPILAQYGVQMKDLKSALIAFFLHHKRPLEAGSIAKKSMATIDPFIILPALINFLKNKRFKLSEYFIIAEIVNTLQKSKTNAENYDLAGQLLYSLTHNLNQLHVMQTLVSNYKQAGVKMSSNMVNLTLSKLSKKPEIFDEMSPILNAMIDSDNFADVHVRQKSVERGTRIEQLEQELAEFEANNQPTQGNALLKALFSNVCAFQEMLFRINFFFNFTPPIISGTLFKLFSMHMQKKDVKRARIIFGKCKEAAVVPTAPFLSTCIQFWILEDNVVNALKCYEQLQAKYKPFSTDAYKIIDLMTLLINKDRFSDAERVIKISPGGNPTLEKSISRNVWDLMTATSNYAHRHQHTDNMAKKMLDNLVRWGFCRYSKPLQGVVIKEYLDKFDILQATEYFLKCANDHQTTPHFLTLLTILVDISVGNNEEMKRFQISSEEGTACMQRVIDAAIVIYSSSKVNATILMALACTGNEEHTRCLLQDPMVEIDAEQLARTVDYLGKRGQLNGLGVLLRAARGTKLSALDPIVVFSALFKRYEIENDFNSALELYEMLSNDGYTGITKKFGKQLREFLVRNEQDVPEKLLLD